MILVVVQPVDFAFSLGSIVRQFVKDQTQSVFASSSSVDFTVCKVTADRK